MIKVGSIVVVKKLPPIAFLSYPFIKWVPVDDEKTPYTIRRIDKDEFDEQDMCVFEEGIIGIYSGCEFGVPLSYVREILPPGEVNIEEIIKETKLEPV